MRRQGFPDERLCVLRFRVGREFLGLEDFGLHASSRGESGFCRDIGFGAGGDLGFQFIVSACSGWPRDLGSFAVL